MIRRAIMLSVAAALAVGLLLLGGTAVMSLLSPVSASRLPALIAGRTARASAPLALPTQGQNPELGREATTSSAEPSNSPVAQASASELAAAAPQPRPAGGLSGESQPSSVASAASAAPLAPARTSQSSSPDAPVQLAPRVATPPGSAVSVMIAALTANPSAYHDRIVSITGRVTRLSGDKLLINDGTGQIIVDLDDDLAKVAITNGATLTVVGALDDSGSGRALEIDAHMLRDRSGAVLAGHDDGMDDDDLDDDADDDVDDDDLDDDADDDVDDDDLDDDADDNVDDDDLDDDSDDDDSDDDD